MSANAPVTTNLRDLQRNNDNNFPAVVAGFGSLAGFELLQRGAKALASSTLVPVAYQGNVPNCMIALNMSNRLHADELMVMQNLYVVHGNPGWSSKFLIASVNSCGRYSSIRYEWRGKPNDDDYGCRAWAVEKLTSERLDGTWIDWKMVKAEGWSKKNGSKWLTMPDQMFIYRAAAFWQRAYAPEISMGLSTSEEMHDVYDAQNDGAGNYSVDHLADLKTAAGKTIVQDAGEIIEPEATPAAPAAPAADEKQSAGPSIPALYQEALKLAKKGSDLCLDLCRDLPDEMAGEIKAVYQGAVDAKK